MKFTIRAATQEDYEGLCELFEVLGVAEREPGVWEILIRKK